MDTTENVRSEMLARTEAAIDSAAARLEQLRVGVVPLPSHPRVATPPAQLASPPVGSDSESAGYGSGSSYSSRGRLSPRASVHPDAQQAPPPATGFAAKRKLLMSLRRRRRELEALATHGTEGERHAALASLGTLHGDMNALYAELRTLQAAARIEEK
jgi:hypothetical protein